MGLTKAYTITVDGKQAVATVGQLKSEIERLEEELLNVATGSKEADEAIRRLGQAKGALKELDDAVDALDPKMKAAAFVDAANGIVGAVSAATAAFTLLGVESDYAKEAEQKLLGLVTVMGALEQISRATNSETLSVIKSTYAQAKGWLFAGEAATTGSRVTKAALISTGIGAIVVALGVALAVVVENWDRLTASAQGSESWFTKAKATLSGFWDAFIEGGKSAGTILLDFFSGDYAGVAIEAQQFGRRVGLAYARGYRESLFESSKASIQLAIEERERLIEINKAKGRDTYEMERQNLRDKIRIAAEGTAEEKKAKRDLIRDLALLNVNHREAEKKAEREADAARLNARIQLEETKGNDAAKLRLKQLQTQLSQELGAEQVNQSKVIGLRGQIDALLVEYRKKAAAAQRETLLLQHAEELADLEREGRYTLDAKIRQQRELLALDTDTSKAGRKQREEDQRVLRGLLKDAGQAEIDIEADKSEERQKLREQDLEVEKQLQAGVVKGAQDTAAKLQRVDFGRTILEKLFGVAPDEVERVQQRVTEAFTQIAASVQSIASTMLDAGLAEADKQADAAKERLDALDKRLSESQAAAEKTEQELAKASGARRDFLLQKLAKEREQERQLSNQKAQAARDEQAALDKRAKLEERQQKLTAATLAIETVLAGVKAAQAVAETGGKGKFGFDNIALAVAMAGVLAAGFARVKNAVKMADGGIIAGPRHAQGGVRGTGAFANIEAEGGEMVIPVDATANNLPLLELIRTKGRRGTLGLLDLMGLAGRYEARPAPGVVLSRYADGGKLPAGGGSVAQAGGLDSARLAALEAQAARTNELLAVIAGATSAAAKHTSTVASYGPPVLAFGYQEAQKHAELVKDMQRNKAAGELTGQVSPFFGSTDAVAIYNAGRNQRLTKEALRNSSNWVPTK